MKLIIDTSEEDLDCIKYLKEKGWASRHELQILNGTPLEKHDEEVIKETVESIWDKPPYTELLDKIRAEIVHLHDWAFSREEVLRIIDKYKAESEGKGKG